MKTLACAGDVEGFYSNIDNVSVESNLRKIAIESIKEEKDSNPKSVKEFQEIVLPSLIVLKWELISRELANGGDGAFCNMQLINNPEDEYSVVAIFPDGKTSVWNFEQKSGQLLLVSIVDNTVFDFAELDLGLQRDVKSSLQVRKEVPEETVKEEAPVTIEEVSEENIVSNVETKSPEKPEQQPVEITKFETTSVAKVEEQPLAHKEETPEEKEEVSKENIVAEEKVSDDISRPGYDFGSARWGMTKTQVSSLERSSLISDSGNSLKYNGRYNGASAKLDYVFSGNKLLKGTYLISGSLANEQAYIDSYEKLKEHLTSRYGKPQIDQELWINSLYKENPDRHGFAVYIGHLSYQARWITARSDIILELKSNDYNMLLEAKYNRR